MEKKPLKKGPAVKKDTPPQDKAADKKAGKPAKGLAAKSRAKADAAKPKAEKKPAPARPLKGRIPFICSECYEEFFLPSTYSKETVTCPECMHVGKRPAEDFIRTVNLAKGDEKKALSMVYNFSIFLATAGLLFAWTISPYDLPEKFKDMRSNLQMILGGAVVVFGALVIFGASKYEKKRWEIYF